MCYDVSIACVMKSLVSRRLQHVFSKRRRRRRRLMLNAFMIIVHDERMLRLVVASTLPFVLRWRYLQEMECSCDRCTHRILAMRHGMCTHTSIHTINHTGNRQSLVNVSLG